MSICKCTGNCPISEYCYRYMKELNIYGQTYSCLENNCIPNNYSDFIPYEKNIREKEIIYGLDDFIMDEINKAMNKTN